MTPFLQDGFLEEFVGAFALGRGCAEAFLVDDTPHCPDDAPIGLRGGNDGFDFLSVDRRGFRRGLGQTGGSTGGGDACDLLSKAWRGVTGDLGTAKDGLEGEADGKFETGAEEGEHAPHGGVEDWVEREVIFQEKRSGGDDKVGKAGVQDGDRDQVW